MEKLILKSVERNLENKLQDLRISKQIPAIVYGKKFPSKPIAVSYSDFLKTFRV
jgi:ribosomal protein L25 (general stress protein Ctc)